MLPVSDSARRFRHVVQQREAKWEQVGRLLADIAGLEAAIADLLDGLEGKAAHAELIAQLTGGASSTSP